VLILLAERDVYAAELVEYVLRTEGDDVITAQDAPGAMTVFEPMRVLSTVKHLVGTSRLVRHRTWGTR
jgi:hypothetical protein